MQLYKYLLVNLTTCIVSLIINDMKTLTVGALKTSFSEVLAQVRQGQEYGIAYGKKKYLVAMIMPIDHYYVIKQKKKLGVLEGKIKITITPNFRMTGEEFLQA